MSIKIGRIERFALMLTERGWLEAHGDMSEAVVNEREVPAGDTPLQCSGGKRTRGASWRYTTAVKRW